MMRCLGLRSPHPRALSEHNFSADDYHLSVHRSKKLNKLCAYISNISIIILPDTLSLASGWNWTEWPLLRNLALLNGAYETASGLSVESRFTLLSIKSIGDCLSPVAAIGQILCQVEGPVETKVGFNCASMLGFLDIKFYQMTARF